MVGKDGKDGKDVEVGKETEGSGGVLWEGSKYGWRVRGKGEKGVVKTRVLVPGGGPDIIVEDRGWDDRMRVKIPKHFPRDYAYVWCKWPHEKVDELIEKYIRTGPWYVQNEGEGKSKDGVLEVLEFIE